MEQIGQLELSWSIGYGGSPIYFVDERTICFINNNCLKIINLDDGSVQFLKSPGDGIQTLAVNTSYGVFAFSEDGLHARIFVYEIGNLKEPLSTLSGGDGLGYTCVAFANNSSILASCSNIPQIQVKMWNWVEGSVLCALLLDTPLTRLSFNPVNWKQVCGSNENGITLWTIAKVGEEYHLQSREFELPMADDGLEDGGYSLLGSRPSTSNASLKITTSAVAGLIGSGKESFASAYKVEKFKPRTHCWGSDSRIFCSSMDNQLLLIDPETSFVSSLYQPEDSNENFSFNLMTLHKEGLFAAGDDGILRCFNVSDDGIELKFQLLVNNSITSMHLSPEFQQIIVGSNQGNVHRYKIGADMEELFDDLCGSIVGICSLGGDRYVVCRSSGLMQIGSIEESRWIAALQVDRDIFCVTSCAATNGVFLGTKRGSIIVIDVSCPDKPKFLFELPLHKSPISKMKIDSSGKILISGSSDGHLFILNGAVSDKLDVLGHTDISGNVLCLSIYDLNEEGKSGPWKVLAGVCSSDHKPGCNQLIEMEISEKLLSKEPSIYMDSTLFLKDVSICKQNYLLKTFIYDIAITSKDTAYAIIHQGKKIAKLSLSIYENTPTNLVIEASITHPGHGLPGGQIVFSQNGKWCVSISPDGYIMSRSDVSMNNPVSIQAGNYRVGGLTNICFSGDGRKVLITSKTGCISCWNVAGSAAVKRIIKISKKILKPSKIEIPKLESTNTVLEQAIMQSHQIEDQKYTEEKTKLRSEIDVLRQKVISMISENDEVPDIEKLDRHEFNMDVEERQKLVVEQEKLIKEHHALIELDDTAKRYQHHLIKTECWDDMKIKGRSIKSFNGNVLVDNYPMRERSGKELQELESCVKRRNVEEIENEVRSYLPSELGTHAPLVETKTDVELDDDENDGDVNNTESAALYGSLGYAYGGNNELLQTQFMLHTKAQKRDQIILLHDCIYKMKTSFNKQFDDVYNFKVQEVRRINERNVRLEKILSDMKIDGESIVQVALDQMEIPEKLLEVTDEEITVEKYISEKERKLMEEEARLEEERRRAENADNARERALDLMMAGRLETNIEEELKEEIEEPAFIANKPTDEWSEEEKNAAKEYEKKKIQLNEEREKYRKSLETELKKLQSANVEAMSNFDERLNQLFQRRIKTEMVILQEELKVVRLNASILTDEELDSRVQELLNFLEIKKDEKQASSLNVGNAKREVEAFKESYEGLILDDRTLDRSFRKEFPELDAHSIDVLYKLFKKRPRAQRTLKAASEVVGDLDGNPFPVRPSSSRVTSAAVTSLEKAMQELDGDHHIPENIDMDVWKKFVVLRRTKVEKEQQLKAKALVLADMNAYLQRQINLDEDLKFVIEKTFEDIQRLREEKLKFSLNLEVQLLLKQGQVEVGNCDFVHDYSDSLLIHRSAVEDLNVTIKTLGDVKLASMRESKDFRKGIHLLAWQLKEMFMKAEDLQSAAQDLQMLRVTKELQVYLSENDQRQSKQQEIGTLEKTLEMYKKMHQRNIHDRKRVIRNLKRQIKEKNSENEKLDNELEELALCVAERKNINDVNADHRTEAGASKRMQDIITRRKLVDLAKAQANEIGMLRAEVERLRMRTFPALVQSGPV